ncbi:MAG: spore germination protein [Eubacteriaceae bacterium]
MSDITIENLRTKLSNSYDIKYRKISNEELNITLVYVESLCDAKYISEFIITPLIQMEPQIDNLENIKNRIILSTSVEEVEKLEEAVKLILSANVLIFFSSSKKAISCDARGYEKRAIDIPSAETVIKGPREGFTEDISCNISLIRRRVKTPDLKIEKFIMGTESQTVLTMMYLQKKCPKQLVDYIRDKIKIANEGSFVFYNNNLEEKLKCKNTSFDTIGDTEKPDVAAAKLSEGRVLVLLDGTAFVMTAPYFFIENFQTTDDYTMNKYVANLGRIFRYFAFIVSVLLPGLYLALVTFHFKLIPSIFLFRMAVFRAGVPVPTVIELLYMIIFFQVIREAGVRLPQPIGPTLSIVGALILGEAAVNSGLASQVTVVIVAISSISSYLIPKIYISIFVWNLIIIGFTTFLGLPGFYMGFIVLVAHLADLTTCGYPFLYPLGTGKFFNYKDIVTRGDMNQVSEKILIKDDD